jgi:hypothetical protein
MLRCRFVEYCWNLIHCIYLMYKFSYVCIFFIACNVWLEISVAAIFCIRSDYNKIQVSPLGLSGILVDILFGLLTLTSLKTPQQLFGAQRGGGEEDIHQSLLSFALVFRYRIWSFWPIWRTDDFVHPSTKTIHPSELGLKTSGSALPLNCSLDLDRKHDLQNLSAIILSLASSQLVFCSSQCELPSLHSV